MRAHATSSRVSVNWLIIFVIRHEYGLLLRTHWDWRPQNPSRITMLCGSFCGRSRVRQSNQILKRGLKGTNVVQSSRTFRLRHLYTPLEPWTLSSDAVRRVRMAKHNSRTCSDMRKLVGSENTDQGRNHVYALVAGSKCQQFPEAESGPQSSPPSKEVRTAYR